MFTHKTTSLLHAANLIMVVSPRSHWGGICALSPEQLKEYIAKHGGTHSDCQDRPALIRRAHQLSQPIRSYPESAVLAGDQTHPAEARGPGCPVALKLGESIYRGNLDGSGRGYLGNITTSVLERCGGRDGLVKVFEEFYNRMFSDPRMAPLFGWRRAVGADSYDGSAELPTAEHGRRLATFILQANGLSSEYENTPHDGHKIAHQHSKRCPMRPQQHKDAVAFTVQQRAAWLGNLALACDTQGIPHDCKAELLQWALDQIGRYGPFVQEEPDVHTASEEFEGEGERIAASA